MKDTKDVIAGLRKEAGLTQEEMASLLHVTRQAVSRWEMGETAPTIDMVELICSTFGVSVERFFDEGDADLKRWREMAENERAYGEEIRAAYGDEVVDAANKKYVLMGEVAHLRADELELAIKVQLRTAMAAGSVDGPEAQKLAAMHKRWITMYWPEGLYSPESHKGLADGYVADARFTKYYEEIADGATKFLRDAIHAWADTLA